jgi:hypothetical protein
VYVVMGAPNAVINGFEARVLGMDVLLWRAQEETRTEILPEGMVAPTARTAADLNTIVDSWLLFGKLSVVAKRQTANYVGANGKRDRTDREHPWMVTMTLSDAEVKGKVSSFGKKVGQLVLGFEKRDAPLHLPRQMQKPPRPWSVTGRKYSRPSFRGGYSKRPYQPWDSTRPYTAPSSSWSGNNQSRDANSWSNWGGSEYDNNSSSCQGHGSGYGGGGRSNTGYARSVMRPASKKAKGPSEEDTLRDMPTKATGSYRGNPTGIAAMTEKGGSARRYKKE